MVVVVGTVPNLDRWRSDVHLELGVEANVKERANKRKKDSYDVHQPTNIVSLLSKGRNVERVPFTYSFYPNQGLKGI